MAGGSSSNHPKSTLHNKPPPSSHRKSRWEPNSSSSAAKSPPDPTTTTTTAPSPKPKPKPNPNPNPSPKHPPLLPFPDPTPSALPLPPPMASTCSNAAPSSSPTAASAPTSPSPRLPRLLPHLHPRFRLPDFQPKRKYADDDDAPARDDLARHRDHLLRNANGLSRAPAGDFSAGPSDSRPSKHPRLDGGNSRHSQVDQNALRKTFFNFAKLINENVSQKRSFLEDGKQGRLHCLACGSGAARQYSRLGPIYIQSTLLYILNMRSAKDFPDMHALIMHTYHLDNADSRVEHLGLHKALCVLMGWNYSKPPDNSKAYQFLSADEAAANQDDLIMWPPLVIIHNTNTGKNRDGRMEGLGNKTMDNKIRELGFMGGKSKSLYGRDGHLGITLVKFAGDQSGFKEAIRLAEHFEKENHGRKDWARVQSQTLGKDDENNANLVKVDEKKGEKRRVLYGYLGTAFDLDKVDFDTRKKVVIESKREYKPTM
ncbi:hypothetical protein Fmac_023459 [Flemingia macrophylla]|uniref:XS domain-containing protein n=1 Tax=Flemingia macrophylla TaxID=520843 RepID=A0ABD1LLJ7_9FABA